MESEIPVLEVALKAFGILSIIPVVIFALWSEYFSRRIHEMLIKRPLFEKSPELEKVKLVGMCVILFQLTLFLGSSEIRHAFPLYSELIFVVCSFTQFMLQVNLEKKIQPHVLQNPTQNQGPVQSAHPLAAPQPAHPASSPENKAPHGTSKKEPKGKAPSGKVIRDDLGAFALRATLSWIIGAALYLFLLATCIRGASWIANQVHASPKVSAAFLFFGGALGVVIGLGVNLALSPFHLKKILPTQELRDPGIQLRLESYFIKAGLKTPRMWVIHFKNLQVGTTLLTGLQNGIGPFRQGLFISHSALKNLSHQELSTLVFSQISHSILKHFQKRFFYSFLLIAGTIGASVVSVFVSEEFFSLQAALEIVGPAVALISFFASFKLLANLNRQHEFDADIYSIEKFGVQIDDFASALRKLDALIFQGSPNRTATHPATERRIQRVMNYLAQKETLVPEKIRDKAS